MLLAVAFMATACGIGKAPDDTKAVAPLPAVSSATPEEKCFKMCQGRMQRFTDNRLTETSTCECFDSVKTPVK